VWGKKKKKTGRMTKKSTGLNFCGGGNSGWKEPTGGVGGIESKKKKQKKGMGGKGEGWQQICKVK